MSRASNILWWSNGRTFPSDPRRPGSSSRWCNIDQGRRDSIVIIRKTWLKGRKLGYQSGRLTSVSSRHLDFGEFKISGDGRICTLNTTLLSADFFGKFHFFGTELEKFPSPSRKNTHKLYKLYTRPRNSYMFPSGYMAPSFAHFYTFATVKNPIYIVLAISLLCILSWVHKRFLQILDLFTVPTECLHTNVD